MNLEVEQQEFQKLNYFNKNELLLIADRFSEKVSPNQKKEKIIEQLILNTSDKLIDFFDKYKELELISSNLALKFLADRFPNQIEEIERIVKKKSILLFLYKERKLDLFQDLLFECYVGRQKNKVEYILTAENDVNLEELSEQIDEYIKNWNEKNIWKINVDTNFDKKLNVNVYIEKGKKPLKQFKFRILNNDYNKLGDLELIRQTAFPVYNKRIEIKKIDKKKYTISYDFDLTKEKVWFNLLLQKLFGEYEISEKNEKELSKFREDLKQTLEKTTSISSIDEQLKERRIKAIEIIDKSKLPYNKTSELKKIITSIKYAGPSFKNDPVTTIRDFTYFALDFTKTESIIPSTVEFLNEIYSKIPQSRENFCLNINNKPVLINKNGEIRRKIKLSENEQLSLKLFLGGSLND